MEAQPLSPSSGDIEEPAPAALEEPVAEELVSTDDLVAAVRDVIAANPDLSCEPSKSAVKKVLAAVKELFPQLAGRANSKTVRAAMEQQVGGQPGRVTAMFVRCRSKATVPCCVLLSVTDRLWVRRLQVEAAWAAAAQVVISGAAGPRAAPVNGQFEQVDREVFRKILEPDRWLFVAKAGKWMVGPTARKDARRTESNGWAQSVASAGVMPPPAGAGRWQVADGKGGWLVEQTVEVEVLDAGQAREWAARLAEQVGAPLQQAHQLLSAHAQSWCWCLRC